jgi:RNA polymerase sigma-70 factor (ECF subfamily)
MNNRTSDYSGLDDAALTAVALSERNAYGELVVRHEVPLGRYVRRLLGAHAQAGDDVLQEAFIKAYVNLRDYDPARPFAAWLYRIAHNEAMNYLRKRRAEPQLIDGEAGLLLIERLSDPRDPQARLAYAGLERTIAACLNSLGQRYRDVLVLRYLEDRSYSDIADILEMPPGTVATLIRRGLARLREALELSGLDIGILET